MRGNRTAVSLRVARESEEPTIIDCAAAPDALALRRALGRFATGVTVVTTRTPDGKLEGMTANSFSAVSLDPPLVLWNARRQAPSLPGFLAAGCFAVNVLHAGQAALSRHFATPLADKFAAIAWEPGLHGCPLLPETLARFECATAEVVEAGDHVIMLGRIARATQREGEPLLFAGGRYGTVTALPA